MPDNDVQKPKEKKTSEKKNKIDQHETEAKRPKTAEVETNR